MALGALVGALVAGGGAAAADSAGPGTAGGGGGGAGKPGLFREVTVDAGIAIGYGLALADVDGDGRTDIVLADKNHIQWYRNPAWTKHVMAERLTELDHVCVAARDVDGDGRAEVVVGAGWNPGDTIASGALFHLKAPADRTQRWEPVRLAHDPTMHRLRWTRTAPGTHVLVSVPLHGRGNRNGQGDGVRIAAYHPPAGFDPASAWTTTVLQDRWHATHNAEAFRMDDRREGDRDHLLVAAKEGVFLVDPAVPGGPVVPVAAGGEGGGGFAGAGEVRAGRIGSRFAFVATIEPMHGNSVVIYRPPAGVEAGAGKDPGLGPWVREVIDESLIDGHGLVSADFLGTGSDQVVAGWRAMNRPGATVGLRLYHFVPGSGGGKGRWEPRMIDEGGMACEDLQVADLDGDGDPDLVASGRATRNVKVYFNEARGGGR